METGYEPEGLEFSPGLEQIHKMILGLIESERELYAEKSRPENSKGRMEAYSHVAAYIRCLGAYKCNLEGYKKRNAEAIKSGLPWFELSPWSRR